MFKFYADAIKCSIVFARLSQVCSLANLILSCCCDSPLLTNASRAVFFISYKVVLKYGSGTTTYAFGDNG